MRPRRFSLFFQIFAWFWATMACLAAALIGLELLTTQEPLVLPQRALIERALRAESVRADALLKSGGEAALRRELRDFSAQTGVEVFWIETQSGREVRGRAVPLALRELARNATPHSPTLWRASGFLVGTVFAVDGKHVFVARFKRGVFAAAPFARLGRFSVVVATAGLVCWLLARRFTRPIALLRAATQKLADGDFSARAGISTQNGAEPLHGYDELALLSRDFDTMAGRIETLVGAQKRLVGDVSHELRSPLTRLKIALALASRDVAPFSAAPLQGHLQRIGHEIEELELLVEQLLTLSRLENQLESPQNFSFDWAQTVTQVVADLDWEAQHRAENVQIRLEIEPETAETRGEEVLLKRALENITRNALRYAPLGSTICVSLKREGDWLQTTVRDAGIGVPENELQAIFSPFYRVDAARPRDSTVPSATVPSATFSGHNFSGGTGLGLAIARRAVESHGGKIEARNRENGGLEVEISLRCLL